MGDPRDGVSGRQNSYRRGYNKRWQAARLEYLCQHPLCVMCKKMGKLRAATVVDHILPHHGDMVLFWDVGNWQSLCSFHHNSTKQSHEKTSMSAIGVDGWPLV
jgi:5-methylcytosine-specific restriction protein A